MCEVFCSTARSLALHERCVAAVSAYLGMGTSEEACGAEEREEDGSFGAAGSTSHVVAERKSSALLISGLGGSVCGRPSPGIMKEEVRRSVRPLQKRCEGVSGTQLLDWARKDSFQTRAMSKHGS